MISSTHYWNDLAPSPTYETQRTVASALAWWNSTETTLPRRLVPGQKMESPAHLAPAPPPSPKKVPPARASQGGATPCLGFGGLNVGLGVGVGVGGGCPLTSQSRVGARINALRKVGGREELAARSLLVRCSFAARGQWPFIPLFGGG
jgi:hypothetical protein